MGWMYMSVCIFDFMLAPILWSIIQAHSHGSVSTQWLPLTLQGGGLFHLAMGAVLGISAYGRTQEKLNVDSGTTYTMPVIPTSTVAPPVDTTLSGASTGFTNSVPVAVNAKGQKIIPQSVQPEL
jgi:hypothetical protein